VTHVEKLILSRDQIADQIVTLTASYAPDVNIDGQGVPHGAQLERLTKQLEALDKLIAKYQPWRIVSQVW
jgi:hypothetical protein